MAICPTCGRVEPGKPRSPEHHRRFFAICNVVWATWPESHAESFDNPEHLRKWLLMKVGHRETIRINLAGADPVQAVILAEAAMRAAGAYARARVVGDDLVVFRPKSISWDRLSQQEFTKISAAVEHQIYLETGIEITDKILDGEVHEPNQKETDTTDHSE